MRAGWYLLYAAWRYFAMPASGTLCGPCAAATWPGVGVACDRLGSRSIGECRSHNTASPAQWRCRRWASMGVDRGTQGTTACGRLMRGGIDCRTGQDRTGQRSSDSPYTSRFMTRLRAQQQKAQLLAQVVVDVAHRAISATDLPPA